MLDIYLKPEEIKEATGILNWSYEETMLDFREVQGVAKASADNAVRVIIEYIEANAIKNKSMMGNNMNILALDWQELKKLTEVE